MQSTRISRRRWIAAAAVSALVLLAALTWYASPFFSPGINRRFRALTDDWFREEVTSSTLNLHYTLADPAAARITDYPITFGSMTVGDPAAARAFSENRRAALLSFPARKLSAENRLVRDILLRSLELTELPGNQDLLAEPLGSSLGIQAQLPILLAEYAFRTPQDVRDYLELLTRLPAYFEEILDFEREKAQLGLFMNDDALNGILEQCDSFLAEPSENCLLPVFEEKLAAAGLFSDEEAARCTAVHRKLVASCVIPAYETLREGLAQLAGTGVNPGGLARLPGGRDYYVFLLRAQTGIDDAPQELEARLLRRMKTDFEEAEAILTAEPSLLLQSAGTAVPLDSPEEMLEDLRQAVTADFPEPPDEPYTVKYVDKTLEEFLSPAFYLTPPADTHTPNSIYINRHSDMDPLELYTTLAHEGFPGHLYQTVSFAGTDAPLIRHLYAPSGYVEGWATYIESYAYGYAARLTKGAAADNVRSRCRLAWLNRSINLCLYSLLDLGIHYHGWLREDAAAFLTRFGITDADMAGRVFQYIVETPGNYLKYYGGYLGFLDLKESEQARLGEKFSLKDFHARLLRIGPAPFSLVKKYLEEGF